MRIQRLNGLLQTQVGLPPSAPQGAVNADQLRMHISNLLQKLPAEDAADIQASAIFQNQDLLAAKPRLHFPDAIEVYDGGAMNPDKVIWIQFGFQRIHRASQH